MDEQEYLEKNIFFGLKNLNDGFDAESIQYFSQTDFEMVLSRIEKYGVGILGIEPWKNGEFFDAVGYEDFTKNPSDPNWYKKAFKGFVELGQNLQYAATYCVPKELLNEQFSENIILISPKHFTVCVSTLQEEVQQLGRFKKLRIITKRLSPVAGIVKDDGSFTLESNNDPFSKRLMGVLKEDGNRTIVEAKWFIPFWSKIYGHHEDNEDLILNFLKKWLLG